MSPRIIVITCVVAAAVSGGSFPGSAAEKKPAPPGNAQVPTWSQDDLNFFLHGSMSTEVIPEAVLRAFIKTYPDLFPTDDLTHLGLIPDPDFGWPIGFSRKKEVKHLGGLSALGINCASCHFVQMTSASTPDPIRILGGTSHFNVEAFFGSVLVSTFKTSDPANMRKFLAAYLATNDPGSDPKVFETAWQRQEETIIAVMKADPFGAKDIQPGDLHKIEQSSSRFRSRPQRRLWSSFRQSAQRASTLLANKIRFGLERG